MPGLQRLQGCWRLSKKLAVERTKGQQAGKNPLNGLVPGTNFGISGGSVGQSHLYGGRRQQSFHEGSRLEMDLEG